MDRRTPVDEAAIRADERAKIVAELEQYATDFVVKWGPITGWDDAKASAWNICVAAKRLLPKHSSASEKPRG